MNHYVYLLEFPNGMGYVGLHSTKIDPAIDTCYLGSGRALPPRSSSSCKKTILATFPTREEAVQYEIDIIELNDCVASDDWYNLRKRTHDKHGSSLSPEHRQLISETHKGRDRSAYGKKYTGVGRTPAQRAGSIVAAEKVRGTKCPNKGKPGTSNTGFSPWYYIDPTGNYVEIHDIPKQDYAAKLGVNPRQLGHRFHYTNEHVVAKSKPLKGWTFGNLPRPTDTAME